MDKGTAKKLERFAQFIEKLPRKSFEMRDWVSPKKGTQLEDTTIVNKRNITECGTACCLAGWEAIRRGKTLNRFGTILNPKGDESTQVSVFARESLELTPEQAERLFFPGMWPSKEDGGIEDKFHSTPKGAAKRIRHLIATGK